MVQYTVLVCRDFRNCTFFENLTGLLSAQEIVCSIQYTCFCICINSNCILSKDQAIALRSENIILGIEHIEQDRLIPLPILPDFVCSNGHCSLFLGKVHAILVHRVEPQLMAVVAFRSYVIAA